MGGTEMAHCVKGLATKPENPSSIPGTHLVGGENQLLKAVLYMAHVHPAHINTSIKIRVNLGV